MPSQQADEQRTDENVEDGVGWRQSSLREEGKAGNLHGIRGKGDDPRQAVFGGFEIFPEIANSHGLTHLWLDSGYRGHAALEKGLRNGHLLSFYARSGNEECQSALFSWMAFPSAVSFAQVVSFFAAGVSMRVLGSLVLYLSLGVTSALAGSNCKVNVVFRHAPKPVSHFDRVLAKAEAGDRLAQLQAGVAFETGSGTAQNYAEAVKRYRKAADLGEPGAQNNLGGMYLRGLGVPQDDGEALRWYLRAAGEGYLPAMNNVGFMNASGRGTRANDEEAVRWYRRAAEKAYAPAQANLAFMYAEGRSVPIDGEQAVQWYHKAAAQNYAPAEYKLGLLYYHGAVISRNLSEALRLFRQAAEHGSAAAENEIAYLYEHGEGVPQNFETASKWYQLAAEHGLPEARKNLEILSARILHASGATDAMSTSSGSASPGEGFVGGRVPQ
jgi:hypothetical protein